jgi:hypothetical protein
MHDAAAQWVTHFPEQIMACLTARPRQNSGGFWMKSKGSKPARWSGILVIVAALAALALSAGRVARIRRSGKRSG